MKYVVYRTVRYTLTVKARSEEEALQKAKDAAEEDFEFDDELELVAEPVGK